MLWNIFWPVAAFCSASLHNCVSSQRRFTHIALIKCTRKMMIKMVPSGVLQKALVFILLIFNGLSFKCYTVEKKVEETLRVYLVPIFEIHLSSLSSTKVISAKMAFIFISSSSEILICAKTFQTWSEWGKNPSLWNKTVIAGTQHLKYQIGSRFVNDRIYMI